MDFFVNVARKATGAFLIALAGTLGTAMLDGDLVTNEIIASIGTALIAGAGVYTLTNKQVP